MEEYKIDSEWNKFEQYISNTSRGLTTGFPELDRTIIGLPGLVTIMGEPKCCKSTLVMNILLHKAEEGFPVILLDRENGLQRTRIRICCYYSGLSVEQLKSNKLSSEEQRKYNLAVEKIKSLPIYYIGQLYNQEEIEKSICEIGKKYKKPILFIADSLQKLVLDFKDRRASVDYWVFFFNSLKIKYENWLTIILVSEKNRFAYGMSKRSGAKESGGIEYTSEMVLDLYPNEQNDKIIIINCIFNRDGDTGIASSFFKSGTYRLKECEYVPE